MVLTHGIHVLCPRACNADTTVSPKLVLRATRFPVQTPNPLYAKVGYEANTSHGAALMRVGLLIDSIKGVGNYLVE